MKPMNKAERWYVYLWLYQRFTDRVRLPFDHSITKAGRAISANVVRHNELHKYGGYLNHEAPK